MKRSEIGRTLRAAGLRSTATRRTVLECLRKRASPASHKDLCAALEVEGLGRGTIFRTLNDLTEAGLVRRTDLGDHVWRFEVKATHEHPHFVCTECGQISCLEGVAVNVRGGNVPRAVRAAEVELQIKGKCDACD